MNTTDIAVKEQTIFHHTGNKIKTEDRDIQIIVKMEEPLIVVLGNVLSHEECDELIQLSKDRVERSKIGNTRTVDGLRTSSSVFLEESHDVVTRVEKRVSQIMNIPVEHGEGLQILNYKPGQEYKAHFDFFSASARPVKNPRISTLVMYLNDVEEGGETYFPKLGLSVSPQKGMAVYFEYFYDNQELNDLTLHGGAPVVIGDKWAATQWMRRQVFK
ncbi:2OG-Fe(II) oxygenase [Rossellomorea vietnamensis]|uniref:2OG-Fe(II) oxygenase n=1 Tax=Rossellomorea vietnamensis TaxID=218284 RepID=A0ACD4CE18_9BACI|nr:2OG-Fe(II) oxygenase [Rossellomorea vietnamensis]UXH46763.1 2OG-Fe(II) oxygenase [Rossellomorea vietnamensis]WQI98119.1 2OG-Fe(II) oxygenase [Rossellomorea vietnamensis]